MGELERLRHELLLKLQELLGDELGALVMESLPPERWPELVTKADLGPLREDVALLTSDVELLKADVALLKSDVGVLKTDVAELRSDVAEVRIDLATLTERFAQHDEMLRLRLERHEASTEALVRERFDTQTKLLVFSILGALFTNTGIAIAAGVAL